jgi:hypothetical protein
MEQRLERMERMAASERSQDTVIELLLLQNQALHCEITMLRHNKDFLLKQYAELKKENKKLRARRWFWPF